MYLYHLLGSLFTFKYRQYSYRGNTYRVAAPCDLTIGPTDKLT